MARAGGAAALPATAQTSESVYEVRAVRVSRLSSGRKRQQGSAKNGATTMLTSLNYSTAARFAAALIIVALGATSGSAAANKRRPVVVVHPRPALVVPVSPYAPYYYSTWNPYSIYSIYDHLSGGRQLCSLPSEPCDNNHRVQN
jgi:hypothetical protein